MKNKLLIPTLLALSICCTVQAEYVVNISLKDNQIKFNQPDANIDAFNINQTTLTVGESATLNWNVLNAESVWLNEESVSKNSGYKSITFDTPGSFSFQLKIKSLSGTTSYSDSKTVNVYSLASIDLFNASSTVVDEGQSSTLSFATTRSVKNTINGVDMGNNNSYVVTPSDKTDYILIAQNQIGKITSKKVTINVQKWTPTDPMYGTWTDINNRVKYNCTWSPNPSTITTSATINQNGTCLTDQTRTRQDRLTSNLTGEVKNTGSVSSEQQTISAQATRPYTVAVTAWVGSAATSCNSWTPATSTVMYYEKFTQNGLNCSIPQTRSRDESYIDHLTGAVVTIPTTTQNQVIIAANGNGYTNTTREATGTKIATVCQPYSTAYSWTNPLISSNPTQYSLKIVWNSVLVVDETMTMEAGSVSRGGYSYTRNPNALCRIPNP